MGSRSSAALREAACGCTSESGPSGGPAQSPPLGGPDRPLRNVKPNRRVVKQGKPNQRVFEGTVTGAVTAGATHAGTPCPGHVTARPSPVAPAAAARARPSRPAEPAPGSPAGAFVRPRHHRSKVGAAGAALSPAPWAGPAASGLRSAAMAALRCGDVAGRPGPALPRQPCRAEGSRRLVTATGHGDWLRRLFLATGHGSWTSGRALAAGRDTE